MNNEVIKDFTSPSLDLGLLALEPIGSGGNTRDAVVGFVPNQFTVPPSAESKYAYKITAESNNLEVRGTGFTDVMSTDFTQGPVTMTVYFKVLDTDSDVTLFMKHWKTTAAGCVLQILVNDDTTLTRHIDGLEDEGGGDNVSAIPLRYKQFDSVDYCDFLKIGLNVVTITIKPTQDITAPDGAGYAIRALYVA